MKTKTTFNMNTFVLALMTTFISINTFGQITWCPTGATWHNKYSSIGGYVGYVKTKYVSDTVVAGMNCKKLIEHQRYRYYLGGPIIDKFRTHFIYDSDGVVFHFNLIEGSNNWDTLFNFNTPVNSVWHINSTDTMFIKVFGAGTRVINNDTLQWRLINFVFPQDTTGMLLPHDTLFERIGVVTQTTHYTFNNPMLNYDNYEPSIFGICSYYDSTFGLYGNPDSICTQLPTGIPDFNAFEKSVIVFPNPFSEDLTIQVSSKEQLTVSLFNLLGETIFQKTFSNSTRLNTDNLPDGIYFYQLNNDYQIISNGKVIKH